MGVGESALLFTLHDSLSTMYPVARYTRRQNRPRTAPPAVGSASHPPLPARPKVEGLGESSQSGPARLGRAFQLGDAALAPAAFNPAWPCECPVQSGGRRPQKRQRAHHPQVCHTGTTLERFSSALSGRPRCIYALARRCPVYPHFYRGDFELLPFE